MRMSGQVFYHVRLQVLPRRTDNAARRMQVNQPLRAPPFLLGRYPWQAPCICLQPEGLGGVPIAGGPGIENCHSARGTAAGMQLACSWVLAHVPC